MDAQFQKAVLIPNVAEKIVLIMEVLNEHFCLSI